MIETFGEVIPIKSYSYSQCKADILSGRIPAESFSTRTLNRMLQDAIAIGDQEMAALIEPLTIERKEAVKERNRKRALDHYHNVARPFREAHKDDQTALAPINTEKTEYTKRQIKIIRGEIPYEEARTRDYNTISAIALNREDFDLASRMEDLAREKHSDAVERNRENARKRYAEVKNTRSATPRSTENDESRTYFKRWERDIIESHADPWDYELEVLEQILKVARNAGDETAVRIMEFLIAERTDPSSVYTVKSKEEAVEAIEKLTIFPIRRPDDWFPED